MQTAFIYTDRYFDYGYGSTHPLKIERLRLTYDLCRSYGLFDLRDARLVETEPASENDIFHFHDRDYVDVLKKASRREGAEYFTCGIGPGDNPAFAGVWEWSMLHTGGSLQCARMVSEGEVSIAFNIAGGLHHAGPRSASGFCYVNDPVLTILYLLDRGYRVLYLDIDAHHGDGVQEAFYEDPRVLTVSFHQEGRTLFPGTGSVGETGEGNGSGYCVNVPMLPGTDDAVFWEGFNAVVPRLTEHFKSDVIVSQLGVDSFWTDPLASLELTTNGFTKVVSYLKSAAKRWVALGGGGYNITNVARSWTLAWAIMNGIELPEGLPDSMMGPMKRAGYDGKAINDPEHKSRRRDLCAQYMSEVVGYLEKNVLNPF